MENVVVLALYVILSGLGVWYVTESLIYDFEDEDNNNGPIKFSKVYVHNGLTEQSRPANLFDAIRVLFNFYRVEKVGDEQVWHVNLEKSTSAWACHHCLSIWVAIPFWIFFYNFVSFGQGILMLLATAGISSLIQQRRNYSELRQVQSEEPETESAE